jgi:hypothetical protein
VKLGGTVLETQHSEMYLLFCSEDIMQMKDLFVVMG